MTDDEFDVLDELYFVESFGQLVSLTAKAESDLTAILKSLFEKGWIKVLAGVDDEVPPEQVDWDGAVHTYHFLATKNGLLAHNS